MATALWCEIVCDCCAAQGPGRFIFDSRVPRKELVREAKEACWMFGTDDDSYCPKCVELGKHITKGRLGVLS